jgi:hypothetical protein
VAGDHDAPRLRNETFGAKWRMRLGSRKKHTVGLDTTIKRRYPVGRLVKADGSVRLWALERASARVRPLTPAER